MIADVAAASVLPAGRLRATLANGLEVWVLPVPGSGVVSTCLAYRVGTRDEDPCERGIAHFLEHMMFKGSAHYAPGEIDARTQALGGSNNAYTSHDLTLYYFTFAPDRWPEALEIEADRMAGLSLPPVHVDSERQVIFEEIAMYASDPWDALEEASRALLLPGHPYGEAVLGTRETLARVGRSELGDFHRRWYRPANGVLVLAGEVTEEALEVARRTLGEVPDGSGDRAAVPSASGGPTAPGRIERSHGSVPRFVRMGPAPAADTEPHAALRVGLAALADGRQSRLHRRLVEELELCAWVEASLSESPGPGSFSVTAELHPEANLEEVEPIVEEELARLARELLPPPEVNRARAVLRADWVFGHERVHQQALSLAFGAALFDEGYADRLLASALAVTPEAVRTEAGEWLRPERGVVGRSWPAAQPDRT